MKHLVAIVLFLSACATHSAHFEDEELVMVPYPRNCIDPNSIDNRTLRITNNTNSNLTFNVSTNVPPYQLHGHASNLLYDDPRHSKPMIFAVTLEEFAERPYKVTLSPGDSAIFRSISNGWPKITDDYTYYWQIADSNWNLHLSKRIRLCN